MNLLARFWRLLRPSQRRRLLILQLATCVMAFSTLAGIASIAPFFAVLGEADSIAHNTVLSWLYMHLGFSDRPFFLIVLGTAVVGLVFLSNLINLLGSLAMYRFAQRVGDHFCVTLFDEYVHRDHEFHLRSNSNTLANNIIWEVSRGITAMLQSFFVLSTNLVAGLFIIASIVAFDPLIALVAVTTIGGSYCTIYLLARQRLVRNGTAESLHHESRTRTVAEALGAIREIIVARKQPYFSERFGLSCRSISRAALNTHAISLTPRYILECIVVTGLVGIAIVMIKRDQAGQPWLAHLSFLAFAAYRLLPALQQTFHAFVKIRADRVAFDRIEADLAAARLRSRASRPEAAAQTQSVSGELHDIEVRNVSFRYSPGLRPAIVGATLTIAGGSTVGLVGASGSGKTTLVELILGLLTPTSGGIRVGGIELDPANRASWQSTIGYVPQQSFLFDATLAENVALGTLPQDIDADRLHRAVTLAQLRPWIERLPNGLEERVGERGVRMSGGQRQRLGIARALYRRTAVLILDEPTNALDGLTENEIMATLEGVRATHTVILVAHRLSTVRRCDRIFELEHGRVVGSGTYDELLRESPGFAALVR